MQEKEMENRVARPSRKILALNVNVEESTTQDKASRGNSPPQDYHDKDGAGEASLQGKLNELSDFRQDNKQQLTEIKQELQKTNDRLEEAEEWIEEAETALQAAATMRKCLTQHQAKMEAKLLDHEGRAHRDNIRVYGIPEEAEGSDIPGFLEKVLTELLDLPADTTFRIERAHRALAPKSINSAGKPLLIIAKKASYKLKEEVIRRAWQKRVFF